MENKEYLVVQLCNEISQTQCEEFSNLLNNGYVIFNEYRFDNIAIIVMKLSEDNNFTFGISREDIKSILEKK